MTIAWLLNALALACGAALGVRALLDPQWAARFVRLKPDAQGGGQAEFRATYGGVFAAAHLAALFLTGRYLWTGELVAGMAAAGAAVVLGAAWAGACIGRAISIYRDNADTRFNRMSAVAAGVLALVIAMPWLVWSFAA